MSDMMEFPETVKEFMEEYKIVDRDEVYTNGAELVPIFRMEQWFEHEKAKEMTKAYKLVLDDLRKINMFNGIYDAKNGKSDFMDGVWTVMACIAYGANHEEFEDEFCNNRIKSIERSEQ